MLTENCKECGRPHGYAYEGPRCVECENVDECPACGDQAHCRENGFCERCQRPVIILSRR